MKVEKYLQAQAKQIIDELFNAKLFSEKVTRDDMNSVEDLFAFTLQSSINSAVRCFELTYKFRNRKEEG